jgi:hypothetical protein
MMKIGLSLYREISKICKRQPQFIPSGIALVHTPSPVSNVRSLAIVIVDFPLFPRSKRKFFQKTAMLFLQHYRYGQYNLHN